MDARQRPNRTAGIEWIACELYHDGILGDVDYRRHRASNEAFRTVEVGHDIRDGTNLQRQGVRWDARRLHVGGYVLGYFCSFKALLANIA